MRFLFIFIIICNLIPPALGNDLDNECLDYCKANGATNGHFLPQTPGNKCKEGFIQDDVNQICCCYIADKIQDIKKL